MKSFIQRETLPSDAVFGIEEVHFREATKDFTKEILLTVSMDGTVTKGPKFTTTDEASLAFWEAVERNSPASLRVDASL